ncbi:MAG: MaoC family dehydratase [Rhodospirillaceae bacterium]|nr:MaoC family dehydratase [Rhodospirillaceae bacterium]
MSAAAQSSSQSRPAAAPYFFEDLQPGMAATFSKTVTEADIVNFAEISGDTNPVHLDAAYAATTMFKQRIAHGMLSVGFISAVFGTVMPGPGSIYVTQNLKFKAPVKIGDTVMARVEVTGAIPEKKFVTFKTQCLVGDKVVIDGEATLMVPARA